MTQPADFQIPLAGPSTPVNQATSQQELFDALLDMHAGSSRPSYAVQNTVWSKDTGASPQVLEIYFFDGTDDILLYTIDVSANSIVFSGLVIGTDVLAPDGDGSALTGISAGISQSGVLEFVGSTEIKLNRKDGSDFYIDGTNETIPIAGVSLANTGLTQATLYYIYAFMTGSVVTLEASVTVPVAHTDGTQIKTGDATRALVGKVYTGTGTPGIFVDSVTQLWTASYFNRKKRVGISHFSTNRSTASTSYVELNSEIRVEFITWGDVVINVNGATENPGGTDNTFTSIGIDGTTPENIFSKAKNASASAGGGPIGLTHGRDDLSTTVVHFATLLGKTDGASTGSWMGSGTLNIATGLQVEVLI